MGDVVLVEQSENVPQFMREPHIMGRVFEIGLMQGVDNVRGHMFLKSGGGEAMVEQGRDAVAPGKLAGDVASSKMMVTAGETALLLLAAMLAVSGRRKWQSHSAVVLGGALEE